MPVRVPPVALSHLEPLGNVTTKHVGDMIFRRREQHSGDRRGIRQHVLEKVGHDCRLRKRIRPLRNDDLPVRLP